MINPDKVEKAMRELSRILKEGGVTYWQLKKLICHS